MKSTNVEQATHLHPVHMPGGELMVEIEDDWTVYMTGDVFYVAKISLSNEFVAKLKSL